MEINNQHDEKQPAKRSAFTVMNNVRDNCKQPVSKKLLMLTLATYADADGICYPSNEKLKEATGISKRTIQRMLPALAAESEIDILTPGIGRDKKRIIRLTKYAGKGDTAMARKGDTTMACLNAPRSLGKAGCNSHGNGHELPKGKGALTPLRSGRTVSSFVPKVPYPESEGEMYDTLERLGIEPNPDYDGNFFEQMQASGWTIKGEPVFDWPMAYKRRLEKTMP